MSEYSLGDVEGMLEVVLGDSYPYANPVVFP